MHRNVGTASIPLASDLRLEGLPCAGPYPVAKRFPLVVLRTQPYVISEFRTEPSETAMISELVCSSEITVVMSS